MDCIIVDDDEMMRADFKHKISQTAILNLVGVCTNAVEASHLVMTQNVDLIFLDMLMPGMTGIDFIKTLDVSKPEVIIISSNKDFAVDAFEYDVADYLVKPVTFDRFLKAVTKAKRNIDKRTTAINTSDNHIFIKVASRLVKLNLKDILFIEALADYVTIHTVTEKHTIHATMKSVENTLPVNDFFRIHNSYIVRLDKISAIEDNCVIVNKSPLPVSRNKSKNLMQRITQL